MNFDEARKKLQDNPEVAKKIATMWKDGTPAQVVSDALAEAGISVDSFQLEELLADFQSSQAAKISDDGVDEDQLKAVAGGTLHNCEMPEAQGMTDCEQISIPR